MGQPLQIPSVPVYWRVSQEVVEVLTLDLSVARALRAERVKVPGRPNLLSWNELNNLPTGVVRGSTRFRSKVGGDRSM